MQKFPFDAVWSEGAPRERAHVRAGVGGGARAGPGAGARVRAQAGAGRRVLTLGKRAGE
jgi:hypothetical protein